MHIFFLFLWLSIELEYYLCTCSLQALKENSAVLFKRIAAWSPRVDAGKESGFVVKIQTYD